eukprot:TRINITY_DN35406_c0_g1_i1.p1 TRINITY_DN35406_c0_g1~~TRINITY_DN35406_c0_g1_i1.p1  ORF type:complete len:103 (+),score=5.97 TRINITY_DN35406_c0_g1_i1:449-757(+)
MCAPSKSGRAFYHMAASSAMLIQACSVSATAARRQKLQPVLPSATAICQSIVPSCAVLDTTAPIGKSVFSSRLCMFNADTQKTGVTCFSVQFSYVQSPAIFH